MILQKMVFFGSLVCALLSPSLTADRSPEAEAPHTSRHQEQAQSSNTWGDLAVLAGYPMTIAASIAVPALMIYASEPDSTAATVAVAGQIGYAILSPLNNIVLSAYIRDCSHRRNLPDKIIADTTVVLTFIRNVFVRGPLSFVSAGAAAAYYLTGDQTARGIAIASSAASGALNIVGTSLFYLSYGFSS